MKNYKTEFDLYEEFKISGLWNLPHSQTQVQGTLYYSPTDGIRLKLNGSFNTSSQSRRTSFDFINGISSDGREITLYDSFITSESYGATARIEIFANYLFIGKHYNSKANLKFTKLKIQLFHLDEWLVEKGMKNTFPNSKTGQDANIKYIGTKNFSIKIKNSLIIESDTNMNLSWKNMQRTSLMSVTRSLYINTKGRRSFSWFMDNAYQLKNFVKLCIGENTTFKRFTLMDGTVRQNNRTYNKPIYVFFGSTEEKPEKDIYVQRMNTNYYMLESKLDIYLKNWFNLSSKVQEALQLVFGYLFQKNNIGHFEFLAIAQALETFHRNMYGSPRMTFYKRLESLAKSQSPKVRSHLSGRYSTFLIKIRDSRNYYTHYTPKKHTIKGIQLYWATRKLEIFFLCLLYKELGFSKKLIDQILDQNYSYKQIKAIKI